MIGSGQQRIGKYELYKRMATNKMGELWVGRDSQSKSYAVIKVFYTTLHADSDAMLQFRQQAEQVAALHHPNIARIYDLSIVPARNPEGQFASMICLVMEYIEGQSLAEYMQNTPNRGKLRPGSETVQIFTPVGQAIDYAHQHGIIHGNLKPSNILLRKDNEAGGQPGEPVLTDFGFLKLLETRGGTASPFYLSPEQVRGQSATERSDTYSLGVMLYEFCTGVLPFRGSRPIAIMMQHLNTPPTPPALMNTTLPSALTNVILRSLAKEPGRRFANASSMSVALAQSLNVPIPESLSKSVNIQSIMHEMEDISTLLSQAEADMSPFSASTSSQKNGANGQTLSSRSGPARSRTRRKSALNPWLLASILVLLLAGFATIGTLLLAPQNNGAASSNQIAGHAYFVNSGQFNVNGPQGINDELQLNLSGISEPPADKTYYAWLLADRSVSESLPISLGPLRVDHGSVQLLYRGDAQHTNLLQVASRFLITLEDTQNPTTNPLIDTSTWRYYAEIPEIPSPIDKLHFSMLDHLRHLLVESPELSIRGLHGGLAFWFVKNAFAVVDAANSAREAWHNSDPTTIHNQVIQLLDYIDGSSFVTADVPHGTPLLADAQASQIALLGLAPNAPVPPGYVYNNEVPPGYVYLISEHMGGAIESPQTTPDQKALAIKINKALDVEVSVLSQARQDAKQLLAMSRTQLLQPAALAILNDLATQAQNAYTGQINPTIGQSAGGALWTYNNLQRLVAFDIRPYPPS
ncbi:MAG: protein kinase domain-containing protein [Ktedonobacteraceae bacterium]